MVLQNPISSLGPIGNFMYEGDTLGRGYYQGLANTQTYKDILGMADDAAFDKTLGNIKNPTLNRLGYTARGLQSLGQSLLGFTPNVGSVNIGGGTIPGRVFYEKIMKNPFAKTLGYGTRAFTGLPGIATTGLYGLSQQMKPGSALSKFIKQGPTKYQKLQNELKLKQMQAQKKSLEDRFKNINVENVKKMTNYVTGQQLHGEPSGKGPRGGGKSCFVKGTMLQMADGTEKEISTVELGDNTKGGIVEMTMQGLPQTIYNYKGVFVSGSHWVIEDNEFIAVEDSKHGVLTDKVEPVYTLKTSEHRMWINDIEFGDFETGSDDDWEPHFEAVRQKLNQALGKKREFNFGGK